MDMLEVLSTGSSTLCVLQEEQSLEVQGRWSCSGDGCLFIGGCCIGTYWVLVDARAVLGCPGCIGMPWLYWGVLGQTSHIRPCHCVPWLVSHRSPPLYNTHKIQISNLKEIDTGWKILANTKMCVLLHCISNFKHRKDLFQCGHDKTFLTVCDEVTSRTNGCFSLTLKAFKKIRYCTKGSVKFTFVLSE